MKKLFSFVSVAILSLAAGAVVCSCSSDPANEPDKPEIPEPSPVPTPDPTPEEDEYTDIRNYFISALNGREEAIPSTDVIDTNDADKAVDLVWNLWKEAYAKSALEPLPELNTLRDDYDYDGFDTHAVTWPLSNGEAMKMYLGKKGTAPVKGWPLIISLHGSGESSHDEWINTLGWNDYYNDAPVVYAVPMSPKGGSGCRWYQPSRQQAWEKLLKMAYASGIVDADRIYFMGISEGAYGTQRLASFYADYLAGAAPISGGEPLYSAPAENTANIFYCARTGELDTMYGRLACTRKAKALWDKLESEHPGYYAHYIDIMKDAGHGLYDGTNYGYDGMSVMILKHTRDALPKYFYWENFALGNVNGESYECRKGFYNIRPLEAQNGATDGDTHDAYEVRIEGNTVTLNVYSVTVTPSELVDGDGWSMNVNAEKTAVAATSGKIRIYLNDKLVDLTRPVTVIVNGKQSFDGTVNVMADAIVESVALFFDPARVFTSYIDVTVE